MERLLDWLEQQEATLSGNAGAFVVPLGAKVPADADRPASIPGPGQLNRRGPRPGTKSKPSKRKKSHGKRKKRR